MARSLGYLAVAGATIIALTVVLPHQDGVNEAGLLACSAAAYVLGGILLGVRGLPRWAPELILTVGIVLVGALGFMGGPSAEAYTLFFFWIAVYTLYFVPWRRAAPQVVAIVAVYSVVQLMGPKAGDARVTQLVMTIGTIVVTAVFVGVLKARADRLTAQLDEAARRDHLTGVLNRRGFERVLGDEFERIARHDRALSVIFVDVDHFKRVNDRFGHPVGDQVLVRLAQCLRSAGRAIDSVARIGGEEFALVLPDTDAAGASVVATRLRDAVRSATTADPPLVTVSVGIATAPGDGHDPETLMRAADAAVYAAKRHGRDRVVVASPDLAMMRV